MIHRVRTIDAHAAGEPLRLIIDGFPSPRGRTMLEKRAVERGLKGIYGTIFTGPPNDPAADLRNVTIFADAEVDRYPPAGPGRARSWRCWTRWTCCRLAGRSYTRA